MEYFNMNPKFIRHGGRKAPVGTIQQLADVLDAGLPPIRDHKKGPHLESMTSVVLLDMRFGEAADIIDNFGLGKVSADLHRFVGWCLEVNFEELGIAENGVPYLRCSSSVEGGAPFVFFSTVMERQSGPTFPIMGTCLRFPGLNPSVLSMAKKPVFIQKDGCPVEERRFSSNEELCEYIASSYGAVTYSKEACLKDFSARVEPSGELSDEQVAAARKNVAKTYKKYVEEYR